MHRSIKYLHNYFSGINLSKGKGSPKAAGEPLNRSVSSHYFRPEICPVGGNKGGRARTRIPGSATLTPEVRAVASLLQFPQIVGEDQSGTGVQHDAYDGASIDFSIAAQGCMTEGDIFDDRARHILPQQPRR